MKKLSWAPGCQAKLNPEQGEERHNVHPGQTQPGAKGQCFPNVKEGSTDLSACLALQGTDPAPGGSAEGLPGLQKLHMPLVRRESYPDSERRAARHFQAEAVSTERSWGCLWGRNSTDTRAQSPKTVLVLPVPCSKAFFGADTSLSRAARKN